MLPSHIQQSLKKRYGSGGQVKKAFDRGVVEGFAAEFAGEAIKHSAAIFVDIAGFSKKMDGLGPRRVREYLDAYYEATLPAIFALGGMVDRIAGDGIVAIYSGFFQPELADIAGEDAALKVAEQIVRKLRATEHAAKAAVATGPLLYCKTGVPAVYDDFTVIGTPLTELYRIEEIAAVNQVVLRADCALGERVWAAVLQQARPRSMLPPSQQSSLQWVVSRDSGPLRGVNGGAPVPLLVQKCVG